VVCVGRGVGVTMRVGLAVGRAAGATAVGVKVGWASFAAQAGSRKRVTAVSSQIIRFITSSSGWQNP